jgi:NADH:ubiquinone oxidoreductase subunit 6 (subunit J)
MSLFINEIIDMCISEISKEETKKKINTYIIEPSFTYIFDRLYPYLILTLIIFVLILLMAIIIIIILVRNSKFSM